MLLPLCSRAGGLTATPRSNHNGIASAAAASVAAAAIGCRLVRAWVCWLSAAGTLSSQAVPPSVSTAARCQHRYACSTALAVNMGPCIVPSSSWLLWSVKALHGMLGVLPASACWGIMSQSLTLNSESCSQSLLTVNSLSASAHCHVPCHGCSATSYQMLGAASS